MRRNSPRPDAGTTVLRLIPFFLFALFAFLLFRSTAAGRGGARPRDWRVFRPRRQARPKPEARDTATDASPFLVQAQELEGLRDAYSGAPLDLSRPLLRCVNCSAVYHTDSARMLDRDNGGRCASCGARDFRAVVVQRH
jgi:DNA-directed RNA polymerase subunit RPC12/RpoP